jgi:hypothetical protein
VIATLTFMTVGHTMLLTNIADHILDKNGELSTTRGFHIPEHPLYKELSFPYYFREEDDVVVDSKGNLAVFTAELIDSFDWDIKYEEVIKK